MRLCQFSSQSYGTACFLLLRAYQSVPLGLPWKWLRDIGTVKRFVIRYGQSPTESVLKKPTYLFLNCHISAEVSAENCPEHQNFCGLHCRPGGVVGIATGYGLDGPGIVSQWGQDFPHLSRPALRPTQPLVQCVPGLSRGQRAAGTWPWPLTPFQCRGQERVELYLYSPYGPYGLYRASVPVQGCTLHYLHCWPADRRDLGLQLSNNGLCHFYCS